LESSGRGAGVIYLLGPYGTCAQRLAELKLVRYAALAEM